MLAIQQHWVDCLRRGAVPETDGQDSLKTYGLVFAAYELARRCIFSPALTALCVATLDGLILYLDDGRLEMDTNGVERAIRPVTITRKNSLFAGSDAGARRWAIANTLIQTCKLNGVEPLGYLTDVLQRIVSGRTKNHELHALLPWNWRPPTAIPRRIATATTTYLAAPSSRQSVAAVVLPRRLPRTSTRSRSVRRHRHDCLDLPVSFSQRTLVAEPTRYVEQRHADLRRRAGLTALPGRGRPRWRLPFELCIRLCPE